MRAIGGYTVTRELGRGGMGTVYQALSSEGATVAIKTVLWPENVNPRGRWEAIERFQREARAARSLTHPNICRVLDYGADEDSLYIVMEFLDGDTVRQLIDLAGKIEPGRAVHIVGEVCEALAHAHDKGIVHRDVKPENIMVLRTGRVKLADFGVASVLRETGATGAGETVGTLYYMSPEQVRGEKVDARSDIFSLGATFYEMLTGTRAFGGERPGEVIHRILEGNPPPVGDVPASQTSGVLERCLQKEPQKRFQTTREMLTSLSALQPDAPLGITAALPAAESRADTGRWRLLARLLSGRKRWVALGATAAVALAGTMLLRPRVEPKGKPVSPANVEAVPAEAKVSPIYPPSLRPAATEVGIVATSLYRGTGDVGGIAFSPDGTPLVTIQSANALLPGVYVAEAGDDCDSSDAYTRPGGPFETPGGIWGDSDGRVLVADRGASTVWEITDPQSPPEALTREVPSPSDVLVAPPEFDGPDVDPGDVLVCASSSAGRHAFGLYVVDRATGKAQLLVGPPDLHNGLLCAAFGPDGTLYAVEDDVISQDGFTIVKVLPEGQVEAFLPNLGFLPQPMRGPIAVHPNTGQVFYAYGSTIYQMSASGGRPKAYAEGNNPITALAFSRDGLSLLAAVAEEHVIAKLAACPIEGKLMITGSLLMPQSPEPAEAGADAICYLLEGRSDKIVPVRLPGGGDLSPFDDEVAYVVEGWFAADRPWEKVSHIWKAGLDGQSKVNLTESTGAGSINCCPLWSPDGRRIAFLHCYPVPDESPCKTGLDIWVMNADGTGARPVVSSRTTKALGSESFPEHWWSPDGNRVLYRYGVKGPVWSVHVDATEPQTLPAFSGNLSPDGSKLVCERTELGTVDGEDGAWRQLCLANPDGSGVQVLVEHFVKDADIAEHLRNLGQAVTGPRWADDVREWVGPRRVTWSPRGDRVAFLAALDFDPAGPHYKFQVEVWIYELRSGTLTRLTDNAVAENELSWRGPNTYPGNREVAVGETSVIFAEVGEEGLTAITREDDRPAQPGGFRFRGDYYDIRTTAHYRGPVKIAMRYEDEDVGQARDESFSLDRYDKATGGWKSIPTSRCVEAHIVCGEVDSL